VRRVARRVHDATLGRTIEPDAELVTREDDELLVSLKLETRGARDSPIGVILWVPRQRRRPIASPGVDLLHELHKRIIERSGDPLAHAPRRPLRHSSRTLASTASP